MYNMRKDVNKNILMYVYVFVHTRTHTSRTRTRTAEDLGDEDWTVYHADDGMKLADYDVDLTPMGILKVLPMLPFKLLCPTYSPVHKVD